MHLRMVLMLAKLAMQLLSLHFVDAKHCGTAHAQSKTSTHGKKNHLRSSCRSAIDFSAYGKP